ncbi:hypothetical protein PG997_006144 [Apiospora hydei]|uniref:Uncharacterized protein n=1 Tax=Apiospora hydei TaxID=1337664 RepID=A0ABR1WRM7_9PEZI
MVAVYAKRVWLIWPFEEGTPVAVPFCRVLRELQIPYRETSSGVSEETSRSDGLALGVLRQGFVDDMDRKALAGTGYLGSPYRQSALSGGFLYLILTNLDQVRCKELEIMDRSINIPHQLLLGLIKFGSGVHPSLLRDNLAECQKVENRHEKRRTGRV